MKNPLKSLVSIVAAAGLVLASAEKARAQGETASGTLTLVSSGSGTFTYALKLTDTSAGSQTIGSLWYAWVPGGFFLPDAPISITPPSGWSDLVVPAGDASSIQFTADAPANYLNTGQSVTFDFTSPDSPVTLAGDFNGMPVGTSTVYHGALFSDIPGYQFVVQSVPEPSTLALLAVGGAGFLARRRRTAGT